MTRHNDLLLCSRGGLRPEDQRLRLDADRCGANLHRCGQLYFSCAPEDHSARQRYVGGRQARPEVHGFGGVKRTVERKGLRGDVSASKRYWREDIVEPEITVSAQGSIAMSDAVGRGYAIREELIERLTVRKETIRA